MNGGRFLGCNGLFLIALNDLMNDAFNECIIRNDEDENNFYVS